MPQRLSGLYVITRPLPGGRNALAAAVDAACAGGARLVQYRDKTAQTTRRESEALALLEVCRRRGVPLVVNDDVELAAGIGADGVHLGAGDTSPETARERLGDHALIGVSCYDEFDRAVAAREAGADYVAFGSFFPSVTKPNAVRADVSLLQRCARELELPACAIGGITPENGGALVAAGADLLAVVAGVFEHPDVEARARRYAALFEGPSANLQAGESH